MKAAVFHPHGGLVLRDVDEPLIQAGEALIEVEACGVCGSDRQVVGGEPAPAGSRFPAILGHEIAGTIAALGPPFESSNPGPMAGSATDWRVGDSVIVSPFIPCGVCQYCLHGSENLCSRQELIGYHRPGGYAQRVSVPTSVLRARPTGVSTAGAALLVDALATPFHALTAVGSLARTDRLVVLGTGGTGLAALLIAKAIGVTRTAAITRRAEAATSAEAVGADTVWVRSDDRRVAREVRRWSEGGADIVLDTVGSGESAEFALELLRPGGRLCLIGMGAGELRVPLAKTVRRAITIAASYGATMRDVDALVELAQSRRLQPEELISRTLPLCRISEAFLRSDSTGRVVIQPNLET